MAEGDQGTRQMNFQVPEEMRTMAERSVTQTRQALESFMQAARRTAETMEQTTDKVQAGAKDMAQRTLSAAEQNLRTSLDYAERLVRAKDLQEATQIQSEFVRTQAEAMQAQMKEFGSAAQSAMGQATDQAASATPTKGKSGKS
jgi:phasin